ncbi:MAG: nicotinate-nucleotide--dimethylbenzimidazole phosphoribosyltransferase [Desulfovibrionaceae bacterium]|nr:nicotinate-nucleotide--dimethylbenzimidazole phosphoribosyltransferase [Desulfovibrionaceae bacterium]
MDAITNAVGGNDWLGRLFPQYSIMPLEVYWLDRAQRRLDSLTKPPGSLGRLEELARRLFAMREGQMPLCVAPALMLTVAADHGVAAQRVSPFPQAVTRQMVMNFLHGGAAINALCACNGMDLRVVDAGCAGGPFPAHEMLLECRLGDGTADMSLGPAMSREQCHQAVLAGLELARDAARRGYACLAVGEMGIANSTAATALYCALLGFTPAEMAGPGAGAAPPRVRHKANVVARALHVNAAALATGDPLDALAAVGGFEIAVICGIMLGAGVERLPVLVDGFICGAAYAAALALAPQLADYAVLAHASAEPGHAAAMRRLGQEPLLDLGLRLGEGTGAALAWQLLRGAAAFFNDMATFSTAGVSADVSDRVDL